MNRRTTVLLGAAVLASGAMPAWAHVTAEDPSVPKDSETEITLSVPVEEGGHTHAKSVRAMHEGHEEPATGEKSEVYNSKVTVDVPHGFEVISCDKQTDWDCSADPGHTFGAAGQPPGGTITFTRTSKEGTTMDHLSFTVHTPTHKGTYRLPTSQKLSNGDETDWNGDETTSAHPAPTLQVIDEESKDAGHK
jgi:uncharacterized protein YcnI